MAVSIEDVKKLREATGVSMMVCKKALEEVDGDFEEAVTVLRKKGEAKAADRAERSTSQGVIVTKQEGGKIAMVQLLCETDFVAMGDDFMALANSFVDKLLAGELNVGDRDLPELKDAVVKMGENIQIGDMCLAEGGSMGDYIHSNKKIGVVVSLEGGNEDLARDISMHIAASNPEVISPDEVSEESVAKEKEIWADQLKQEGKPEEIMEKIMMGKEKKFREENALIKQSFVKDPEKTIEDLLKAADATIKEFKRFAI